MWYIVEGLTGREPNCGSVPFAQVEITSPWKLSGLAFPEEFLEQVLSALGTSKDMYVEIATDKEGVILISPMGRGVVVEQVQSYLRCGHWERYAGDVKKWVEEWVESYAAAIPPRITKIQLSFGMHHNDAPRQLFQQSDDTIRLIFNCRRWSVRFQVQDDGAVQYSRGWLQYYDLYDGCLEEHYYDRTILLLERLLPQVFGISAAAMENATRVRAAQLRLKSRELYTAILTAGLEKQIRELEGSSREIAAAYQAYLRRATNAYAEMRSIDDRIRYLRGEPGRLAQDAGAKFDRFFMNPLVEEVLVDRGKIIVCTAHLVTKPLVKDGTVRDLGRYKIVLSTDGNMPRVMNTTRQVNGYNHPHSEGSEMCWGNFSEGLVKLLAEKEYEVVAQYIIEFLQSPNEEDSWGARIYDWPIAKV